MGALRALTPCHRFHAHNVEEPGGYCYSRGRSPCGNCSGTGRVGFGDSQQGCYGCGGNGQISCLSCSGGQSYCGRCGGSGRVWVDG